MLKRIFWAVCALLVVGAVFGFVMDLNRTGGIITRDRVLHPPAPTATPTVTPIPPPTPEPVVVAAATPQATETPTMMPVPTNTPIPTPTPIASLADAIAAALAESNRGLPRVTRVEETGDVLNVDWSINDNLTDGMIRRGARQDAVAILTAAHAAGKEYRIINLTGSFALRDVYGNTNEEPVVWIGFSQETLRKINWSDADYVRYVLGESIYEIADTYNSAPALGE